MAEKLAAEKKINGRAYKSEPVLATEGVLLQARLFKLIGPGMAHVATIMQGAGKSATPEQKAQSNIALVQAMSDIFAQNDPEDVTAMIKEIAELAQVKRHDGPNAEYEQVDFDGDFTKRKGDILPVVAFVFMEQFLDFFSGLPAIGSLGGIEKISQRRK